MANIQLLDKTLHRALCVKNQLSFEQVEKVNLVPLVVDEFIYAALNFPVVFVKDPLTGEFRVAGLVGLEANENLVFGRQGLHSTYIPAAIKRYPFSAVINEESGNLSLCVDLDSQMLSDTGEGLFHDSGEPTAFTIEKINGLSKLMVQEVNTHKFIDFLFKQGLLEPVEVKIKLGERESLLGGIYRVSENKLNGLDDQTILSIQHNRYFAFIHAHLISLGNIQKLIDMKVKKLAG